MKRIIGLPGDSISYIDKRLYINGKKVPRKFLREGNAHAPEGAVYRVGIYEETLDGVSYKIYLRPDVKSINFYNLKVPPGNYFMKGDNRDNSDDSRFWGFVPAQNLIGKALVVWMSWNNTASSFMEKIRWDRIGKHL